MRVRVMIILVMLMIAYNAGSVDQASAPKTQALRSRSLPFTKNMGQWPDSILFRASANGATMWFTKNGIWYQFFRRVEKSDASASWAADVPSAPSSVDDRLPRLLNDEQPDSIETTMIKAEFVGASESVEVVGLEEMEFKCNYFVGDEPSKWRTDVPNYSAVAMRGLYPGVDMRFSSHEGRLQEELISSNSGELTQVKVEFRGAINVTQQSVSSYLIHTTFGEHYFEGVLLTAPWAVKSEVSTATATPSSSAVSLVYSTYLGGGGDERSHRIAIDASGAAYVTGNTKSSNFPTLNPYQGTFQGGIDDIFVSKVSSGGNSLIYSTYLGGNGHDEGINIAVDASGSAYITGVTGSSNFPLFNSYQTDQGDVDAFVTKLSSSGNSLIYSTYLGGSGAEFSYGIAVDTAGAAYLTGNTNSSNYPTLGAYQSAYQGGIWDAFVTKLSSTGNNLVYSTYLGGNDDDEGSGIAVDGSGAAYVTGLIKSSNFPVANPFQGSYQGGVWDAFVSKVSATGSSLDYSTFLGGTSDDIGQCIAVDAAGSAYVTGFTLSTNYPTNSPYQGTAPGGYDAFVTKLSASGSSLTYSTYLGGSGDDFGIGLALNLLGAAYVSGVTLSSNFPTANLFQTDQGGADAFVTSLSSAGNSVMYSTYLGGSGDDFCSGIGLDQSLSLYLTGYTLSSDFPTQTPFQSSLGGSEDAFVTKLIGVACCINLRGNADGSAGDGVNVVDLTFLVQYLFQGGAAPPCMDEADVFVTNSINVVDLTTLVQYLFQSGPPPPACP